ncbi:hypothetical protein, partial [Burkholderia sp. SIMBA_052]|uniref:hypothetical protein n=1 Tax=Burkholderia sp. SIMBA_052 TaxID=3085793 RepID=UPI00397C50EA
MATAALFLPTNIGRLWLFEAGTILRLVFLLILPNEVNMSSAMFPFSIDESTFFYTQIGDRE